MEFVLENWSLFLTVALAAAGIWLLMRDRYGLALFCFAAAAIVPRALHMTGIAEALASATGT